MKRRISGKKRILAVLLSLLLAVLPLGAAATSVEELEARRESLKQENEQLQTELDALRGDEAKALEYQALLEEKITNTEKRIDSARESIDALNRSIADLESTMAFYEERSRETLELFKQRVRALYMAGNISTLEIILNSASLESYTRRMSALSAITAYDESLMEKMRQYIDDTKEEREALKLQQQQLADVKKELESDQKELVTLEDENTQLLVSIQGMQAQAEEKIAANEEEDEALNAQISDLIEQERLRQEEEERLRREEEEQKRQEAEESGGSYEPGEYEPINPGLSDDFHPRWPTPGYGTNCITGHYGDYYEGSGHHNGLDIGAPYGAEIIAVQAGKVLSSEYHYSWGNNVLIYHNDSFATRYAHCSTLLVSPGEYVEEGQVIGLVGSTGYSFGNHLHFEVYLNGVRTNPEYYL